MLNKIAKNINNISTPRLWNKDVFKVSTTSIENLIKQVAECDFGICIFYPDDKIKIRGKNYLTTSDNIIFELGLFMGKLGRERCFVLMSETQLNFRIPSDLIGIIYVVYKHEK